MDGYSQRKEPIVRFLAQQDGQPERKLQSALTKRFTEMRMVEQAYLAGVRYGNEGPAEVALALLSPTEDQEAIVKSVTDEFHAQCNVTQHPDVIFLTLAQLREVSSVCSPFFLKSKPAWRSKRLRIAVPIGAAVVALAAGVYTYADRRFRDALVIGNEPRLAASDRPALQSLLAGSPELVRLKAAGRIFSVPPGTRCLIVRSDNTSPRRAPQDTPVEVQLLEGRHRGETAWLCRDDIRWLLHALP